MVVIYSQLRRYKYVLSLVHYEVNDFDELAKAKFQIRHDIIRRSVSTASPSKSIKTTPGVITKSEAPFTTGKPTTKTFFSTTPKSVNLTNGTNITSFQVCHVKLMLLEITMDLS